MADDVPGIMTVLDSLENVQNIGVGISIENGSTIVHYMLDLRNNGTIVGNGNPLPVVAPVPGAAYHTPAAVSVSNVTPTVIATAAQFTRLTIRTLPNLQGNIWLACDGTSDPVVGSGLCIQAGGDVIIFGTQQYPMPTGAIYAITDAAAPVVVAIQTV